jgi:hypothetical protein
VARLAPLLSVCGAQIRIHRRGPRPRPDLIWGSATIVIVAPSSPPLSILILVIAGSTRLPPSRALSLAPCARAPHRVLVLVAARSYHPRRRNSLASSLILGWLHAHGCAPSLQPADGPCVHMPRRSSSLVLAGAPCLLVTSPAAPRHTLRRPRHSSCNRTDQIIRAQVQKQAPKCSNFRT